jgi:cytochrome oxidase assembly protein ShyY1
VKKFFFFKSEDIIFEILFLKKKSYLNHISRLDVLKDYLYRRVKTSGKFRHDEELYLGPRTYDGKLGYYVVTPLDRENG